MLPFAQRRHKPRTAPNGRAYLNLGCGSVFSSEWNNLDRFRSPDVILHDLRKPLPFEDESFDAVYSSHVLEHLGPDQGFELMKETFRVTRAGGLCRMVVPDLEASCRLYLECLEQAREEPEPGGRSWWRYRWSVIKLIDQFVRVKYGGKMVETLEQGDFDREFVHSHHGDEFLNILSSRNESLGLAPRDLLRRITRMPPVARLLAAIRGGPAGAGELHKWMYDRFSLRLLMEQAGFCDIQSREYHQSQIPDWDRYALDRSRYGESPRRPDSVYLEGRKPS